MNKKFTFMVAALLAAGGFSANAQVTIDKHHVKGEYYYVVLEDGTSAVSTFDGTTEKLLGSTLTSTTGALAYDVNKTYADVEDGVAENYLWKATAKEVNGKTEVVLVNKATGKELAYNAYSKKLVANVEEYTKVSNLDKTLEYDSTNGILYFVDGEAELKNDATVAATGTKVYLVKAADEVATVEELKNLGTGVKFDFEGTIEGEDLFSNVSVVTITSGVLGVETNAADNVFMLQVGKAKTTEYTALTDEFKNAEFIVLTTTEVVEGEGNPQTGTGYKYAKIQGKNLVKAQTESLPGTPAVAVESGKYPVQNAFFQAEKNANKEGQLRFKQYRYWASSGGDDAVWTSMNSTVAAYVGYTDGGVAGATDKLASAATGVWAELSGGSAVSVKDLVKGKKLVYVMTTAGESSSSFDHLLYDALATTTASDDITFTANADASTVQKNYLTSQWFVSANDDNTITLINRETGAKIENINLFSTVASGVYSAKKASTVVDGKYLKFIDVEGTTAYDGYVNLSDEELKETYKLNTSAAVEDFAVDVVLEQEVNTDGEGASNGAIIMKSTSDKEIVWKIAKATRTEEDEDGEEISVVDTVYQITNYNFYDAGKLKAAADTLKVFKYNLTANNSVKQDDNTNYNALGTGFTFVDGVVDTDETVAFQSVILRKKGDKFVMVYAPASGESLRGKIDASVSTYAVKNSGNTEITVGTSANALAFGIDAVPTAPHYAVPESHFALEIGGAYLGANAKETGILTNDTTMLKSTEVDSSFSFYAFSADKEETKTPSYYLSTNGKLMYNPSDSIKAINEEIASLSTVFEADKIAALYEEKAQYVNGDPKETDEALVKFQQAKYVNADSLYIVEKGINGDALKAFKFQVEDVDGSAVLKANDGKYVAVVNGVAVLRANDAAKFTVVAAEAPTSNESVSTSEVKVLANNGSVVVKNAAGKNVVVSTILGQVVANEVLTSDNATINVPAGIVVVAVEGESFKVNVK